MDASTLPKGKSAEVSPGGDNLPGIYKNKDNGEIAITSPGAEGVIMADALCAPIWQGVWERVGDVPSRTELLAMREAQAKKEEKELAEATKAEAERKKAL